MKYWKTALIFFICIMVQPTLLNFFSIFKSTPNLILSFVVVFAFLCGDYTHSLVIGTGAGILYDMLYTLSIGQTALALFIVSAVILFIRETMNVENMINMFLVSVSSIFVFYSCNWILLKFSGETLGYLYMLKNSVLSGIYTLAVITAVYIYLVNKSRRNRRSKYFQ